MIALGVIVQDEVGDRSSQRRLPKKEHSSQAFVFDRADKPLRIGVQISATSVAHE
jgi:hypothetical protein